jgi:two-component system sensor histidine kinase/response regulator
MDQRRAAGPGLLVTPAAPGHALDPVVLDGLRDLDRRTRPGLLVRVARIFLAQAPRDLATLAEAVARGDTACVATVAHELNGRSAMIGARGLARICAEIDRVNGSVGLAVPAALVGAAEAEFRRVQEALAAQVLAGPSGGDAARDAGALDGPAAEDAAHGGAPCGS